MKDEQSYPSLSSFCTCDVDLSRVAIEENDHIYFILDELGSHSFSVLGERPRPFGQGLICEGKRRGTLLHTHTHTHTNMSPK